jgi:aminopeptidase N
MNKKFKLLFLTLLPSTALFAQCNYDLNINFDFTNKTIYVKTNIKDTQKSLHLDIKEFDIKNKNSIEEALKNGANKVSFSYEKKIKGLNDKYIYLLNNWYPQVNSRCSFDISTNLPNNYKTVYENTDKEIDSFNFIASKDFIIRIKKYNDIAIKTYFLRDDEALVKKYMDKTMEYIKLYEKRVGKFPYNEFKIAENIYQTGYSMPTFTLIGSRLLNKDYILNQSLGHEILHQYFGNSIFNNFEKGNWVEGLTTFLADDYYKKTK